MKVKYLKIISLILVVAIVVTSVFGINKITAGAKIDVDATVSEYNSQSPDFAYLFEGISEENLSAELDDLDVKLSALIQRVDIDSLIYTDSVATLLTRGIAELCGRSLDSIDFKELKKDYPEAYTHIENLKASGLSWKDIDTIPFGIKAGNKDSFIDACAAGAAHLGDTLLKVIMYAPSAYYDALVPALESLHVDKMPSIYGFALQTGLSPSARIKFMLEHIFSIIEPIKSTPLAFLCSLLPDFIINYNKACEFINTNEKISANTGLTLPTIDSIISGLISALNMTSPEIDYDYLSKMAVASSDKSGYNGGKRVKFEGDREVIFAYLGDFILNLFVYEDNFVFSEKLITNLIKSDAIKNSAFADLLYSDELNNILASLLDIMAKLRVREDYNAESEINEYNAEVKNFDSMFKWPATEENVTTVLDTVEGTIVEALKSVNIDELIFTDEFATLISKLTAYLCGRELTDITFAALKDSFPEAYDYITILQSQDMTWNDVVTIPFGIPPGDEAMFIKACGAGAEHFGDALALCIIVNPHAYDDALLPIFEALHTGAMPSLEEFVADQGLDGAYRMEEITRKTLTIMEPIKAAPLTYLFEILPDLILSYNKASDVLKKSEIQPLKLPEISDLLNIITADLGLILPDYDFSVLTKMATAEKAESGNYTGYRMQLNGDREVVFMGLATYIHQVLKNDKNLATIDGIISDTLGMDISILTTITNLIA